MKLTELEYVLLAHLKRRARTGYELGKAFEGLPMGTFSSSPGSIYPALRRLSEAGLVQPSEVPLGRRPRKEFRLTKVGKRQLRVWLHAPVTLPELLRRPGVLALRYSFLPTAERRAAFLSAYVAAALEGLEHYSKFLSEARGHAVDGSIGALELVRDLLVSHRAWAERELDKMSGDKSR